MISSAVDSVVLDHSETAVGIVGLGLGVRIVTPLGSIGLRSASFSVSSPLKMGQLVEDDLPPSLLSDDALWFRNISLRTFFGGITTPLCRTSFSFPSLFRLEAWCSIAI